MIILLIILAMAVLSLEIALESTLAEDVKKLLGLSFVKPNWLISLSKLSFWNKLFSLWLLPINLTFALLFSIYSKLSTMINCPYCLSFWLSGVSVYIYTDNLLESILIGLVTIPVTHMIQKIID